MLVRLNSVFLPDLLTMLNTLATAEFAQLPGSIKSILYLVYCTFGNRAKSLCQKSELCCIHAF